MWNDLLLLNWTLVNEIFTVTTFALLVRKVEVIWVILGGVILSLFV
jgi:hypothetical protein